MASRKTLATQESAAFFKRAPASASTVIELDPIIKVAQATFRSELPQLLRLRNASRQWVAYEGSQRIAFGATKHGLYKKCLRDGFKVNNLYVRSIDPEPVVEILFDIE